MASYQDISFPSGWFNTYPQTQPNTTQHVPGNSKRVRKGVHATDKPEQPPIDLLQQVWLGLLSLAISIGSDESGKNPIFPKTGKSKKSKASNTTCAKTQLEVLQELLLKRNVPFARDPIQT